MILMYSNAKSRHDRKLHTEAQQMLSDSKTKVEVLKMKIRRLKGIVDKPQEKDGIAPSQSSPENRVSMLRYRIDVETRLMQGARGIMKANPNDRKCSQSVSA